MWLYMCVMCTFCNDIKKGYCYSCLERIVSGLAYVCHWLSPLDAIQKHFESLLTFVACHNNLLCFRKFFIVDARCSKLDPFEFDLIPLFPSSLDSKYKKSCVPKVKTHFHMFSVFEFLVSLFWVIFSFLIETAFWSCINLNLR